MYRFAYADVLDDDVVQHRATERMALDRCIELLDRARSCLLYTSDAADE